MIVQFDNIAITLTDSNGVSSIQWETITRVCYNVQAMPWAVEDEIFIFTSEKPEHFEISLDDTGAEDLWEEILRRGLFDSKLAGKMKKSVGVFCWPPAAQDAGPTTLRKKIALVRVILHHSGLSSAVGVLLKQSSSAGSEISAAADEAIDAILVDAQNINLHAQILMNPLINELRDSSSIIRENVAEAIGSAIAFGGNSPPLIGVLGETLLAADLSSKLAERLTMAFWQAALQGRDLGPAVNILEQARTSSVHMIRMAASQALSIYFQKTGVEPTINPVKNLKLPTFKSGGEWAIQIKYRRTYGLADYPLTRECPHYPCAACGSDDTSCLWDEQMSEPFVSADGEVLCRKCGKYSLYEYRNFKK